MMKAQILELQLMILNEENIKIVMVYILLNI